MGCDGGTIPRRDELVRTKKKPEQKDRKADKDAKWKNCAVTQLPLSPPIVACKLGRLYNKVDLIEALIDNRAPSHIKKLRTDTCDLKLCQNNSPTSDEFKYVCPVTGLEMNGNYKFYVIWSCGCVISDRAFRLVSSSVCMNCGKAFIPDDLITLNPDEEELQVLESRLHDKARKNDKIRSKEKCEMKSDKNGQEKTSSNKTVLNETCSTEKKAENATKKESAPKCTDQQIKVNGIVATNGIKLAGKKRAASDAVKKQRGIQEDPDCSRVYKSIFNTCDAAKKQKTAHWTTYNPLYF